MAVTDKQKGMVEEPRRHLREVNDQVARISFRRKPDVVLRLSRPTTKHPNSAASSRPCFRRSVDRALRNHPAIRVPEGVGVTTVSS